MGLPRGAPEPFPGVVNQNRDFRFGIVDSCVPKKSNIFIWNRIAAQPRKCDVRRVIKGGQYASASHLFNNVLDVPAIEFLT